MRPSSVERLVELTIVAASGLMGAWGCGNSESPAAPDRPGSRGHDGAVQAPTVDPEKAARSKSGATEPGPQEPQAHLHCPETATVPGRLVVDVSQSMEGFTGIRAAAVANMHQSLHDAFAEAQVGGVRRCLLGETLDCERAPARPADYGRAGLYRARMSRLDLALRSVECPAQPDPDHPVTDLLDEARLTVLVTDGMQAAATTPGAPATGCQSGADPSCIASLLAARATQGYGIWLVHVALPFHGRHYAERNLDQVFFDRVRAHLAEANRDPRWNQIEFAMRAPRGVSNSFEYQGFKPLLLVVLSREPELGRRFVEVAVRRLRADPIRPGAMADEDAVQSVELAPLAPSRFRPVAIELLPADRQDGIQVEELSEMRYQGTSPAADGVEGRIWCGARGKGLLAVRYEQEEGPVTLPHYVRQEVELAGPRRDVPLPERALAPIRVLPGQAFRAGVNCTVLPGAKTTVVEYELRSRLSLAEVSTTGEWWSALSSDNTYEMPERVYGLRDLALAVLRIRATGVQRWGRVRLRIERE